MSIDSYFSQAKFDQYQSFLKSSGLSRSSIRRRLSSLYSFQRYLKKEGLISSEATQLKHSKLKNLTDPKNFSLSFSNPFQSPNFPKYLSFAIVLVLVTGLGIGLYTQTILKAKKNYAYSTAAATVRPGRQLSFQGRLTDTVGDPITSSTPIVFKLFNQNVGGTQLYTSSVGNSQTVTPDQNGVFSVVIGKTHGTEIDQTVFTNYSEVWLEITAGGETMTPRQQIATVAYALNSETLQGLPPSASGLKNTVLVIDGQGNLNLGETSPSIKSTSGTFGIEGQSLLLKASDGSGGNIEINPDASGVIKLITEGASPTTGTGFINATNANLASGDLFSGIINNTNRGYNFLNFSNFNIGTTTLSSRFSVDASGNTNIGGTLSVNGDINATGTIRNVTVKVGCTTPNATAAKTATVSNYNLTTGDLLSVTFANGNTVSTPTLNINGTGAKNIRLANANVNTTNFSLAAGSTVVLYYDGTYFQIMGSQRTSDSDTYDRIYWGNNITAGAAIYDYKLLMQAANGKWYPLTLETGTGTTKTVSTQEFTVNSPILFYNSATDIAANGVTSNVYSEISYSNLHYTANQGTWTSQLPIYLKGTINSSGNFVLDNTTYTSFMTQALPTSEDGKVYILLGQMFTTSGIRLFQYHPMYEFRSGKLQPYNPGYGVFVSKVGDTMSGNLTMPSESVIGPSATTGIYFKAGNVGIGTTNPLFKLDINGNARIGTTLSVSTLTGIGSTALVTNLNSQYLNGISSNGFVGVGQTGSFISNLTSGAGISITGAGVGRTITNTGILNASNGTLTRSGSAGSYTLGLNLASSNVWTTLQRFTSGIGVTGDLQISGGYLASLLNSSLNNLVRNGSAENGLTYWSFGNDAGSDGAISIYTGDSYAGSSSLRYTRTTLAGWGSIWYNNLTNYLTSPFFETNKTYTLSFFAKAITGTPALTTSIRDTSGTNTVADCSSTTLDSTWKQITCTFTPALAGNQPVLYFTSTNYAAVDILIDSVMLNTGSQAFGYAAVQADRNDNVSLNRNLTIGGTFVSVGSTNTVANLSADLLDGLHSSAFLQVGSTGGFITTLTSGAGISVTGAGVGRTITNTGILNASNGTLTRSGSAGSYTLGLNLGSTNVWTARQTFAGGIGVSGNGNFSGNLSIGGTFVSVGSTNTVTNLSADLLDGYHASNFVAVGSTGNFITSLTSGAGISITGAGVGRTIVNTGILNASNGTLTRSGSAGSYTLGLNLASSNVWTSLQRFTSGIGVTGDIIGSGTIANSKKSWTLAEGTYNNHWIRIGQTNGLTNGRVRLYATTDAATNKNTDIEFYVYAGTYNTDSYINIVKNNSYNNNNIALIRAGSDSGAASYLDIFIDSLSVGGTLNLTAEVNGQITLLDTPTIDPVTPTGSKTITANGRSYGITSAGSRPYIIDGSNVGIGTTNPLYKLDINGNARIGTTLSVSTLTGIGSTASVTNLNADLLDGLHASSFLQIGSTGNFITTLTSGAGISITGSGVGRTITNTGILNASNGTLTRSGSAGSYTLGLNLASSNVWTTLQRFTSGIGVTGNISGTGNLSLGASFNISSEDGSWWQRIRTTDSSTLTDSVFNFEVRKGSGDYTTLMAITNNGNVGIGTTNPTAKLHVAGNGNITGNLTIGGTFVSVGSTNLVTNLNSQYLNGISSNGFVGVGQTGSFISNLTSGAGISITGAGVGRTITNTGILNASNGTLTRSGSAGSYTLGLNLASSNVWTTLQRFTSGIGVTGDSTFTSNVNVGGNVSANNLINKNGAGIKSSDYEWRVLNVGSSIGERTVATFDAGTVDSYDGVEIIGQIIDNMSNWGDGNPILANFRAKLRFSNGTSYELVQDRVTPNVTLSIREVSASVAKLTAICNNQHKDLRVVFKLVEGDGNITTTLGDPNVIDTTGTTIIASPTYSENFSGTLNVGTTLTAATVNFTNSQSTTKVTNLNADLLDGLDSTAFLQVGTSGSFISNLTSGAGISVTGAGIGRTITNTGILNTTNGTLTRSGSAGSYTLGLNLGNANTWTGLQIFAAGIGVTGNGNISGNLSVGGSLVSVGSTNTVTNLSADLLDGYHASSFMQIGSTGNFITTLSGGAGISISGAGVGRTVTNTGILNTTNGTLTRSGSAGSYTLGLNLGNANTWTGAQSFNNASIGGTLTITNASVGTGTTALIIAANGTVSKRALGAMAFDSGTYDNYQNWMLQTNSANTTSIGTGATVNFVNGVGVSIVQTGNTITIHNSSVGTTYSAGVGLTLSSTNIFSLDYDSTLDLAGNKIGLNLGNSNTWTALQNFTNGIGVSGTANLSQNLNVGGTAYFNNNVGIGTSSIFAKLNVRGSSIFGSSITPASSNAANIINLLSGVSANGSVNGISFWEDTGSAMKLGYDGIGSGAINALRFYDFSNNPLVTIQNGGNVGIGTTNPTAKLTVAGNGNITGNLTVGSTFVSVGSTNTVTNLSADLLDGLNSSAFLQVGVSGSFISNLTAGNGISLTGTGVGRTITNTGILNASNGTLTRSGSAGSYTLGLNLASSNVWTTLQRFTAGVGITGSLTVNGNAQMNNLTFANPGIGNDSRITFSKTSDAAYLSVKELVSDSTTYGFYMADNPDQAGDKFVWQMDDWQGDGGDWQPLALSGLDANLRAANINAYGDYNIYGPWYSSTDGQPNTVYQSKTGTLTITPNVSGFTGSSTVYWLKIDSIGSTNTFAWGNGAPSTTAIGSSIPITAGAQNLSNGISVTFNATTGGVVGDTYQFRVTKGGHLLSSNGNVGKPSFSFTSDTDTGMYRSGTNALSLVTAGANRLTVAANGTVSIGTTLSVSTLTGIGSTASVTNLNADLLDGLHASSFVQIGASGSFITSLTSGAGISISGSGVGRTIVNTGILNASNGTLTRSGSAGSYTLGLNLGSTNVWTGLQTFAGGIGVTGNGNISGNLSVGGSLVSVGSTNTVTNLSADMIDGLHASAFMNIGTTGNLPYVNNATNGTLTRSGSGPYTLGLNLGNANTWTATQTFGNVNVGGSLSVTGRASATSFKVSSSFTDLINNSPWYGLGTANINLTGSSNPSTQLAGYFGLNFQTASGTMVLNQSGNVGIGTTNPTAKLTIIGNGNFSTALNVGTSLNVVSNINLNGTTVINSSRAHLAGNGSVGAPSFTFSSDTNTGMYRGGTDILRLATAGVDRVTVLANGNVGIGTTNPTSKLTVAGNGNVTGNFSIGTSFTSVGSNNLVSNLNADYIDGYHASSFLTVGTTGNFISELYAGVGITISGTGNNRTIGVDYGSGLGTSGNKIINTGIINSSNGTLTRSGSAGSYTLGINLANANNWTANQTFAASVGIGTTSPTAALEIITSGGEALKVSGGYIDLPTATKLSNDLVNDLLLYLPLQSSIASSRGNPGNFTRSDTSSGQTATYTLDSGYITHDYINNNIPRFERTKIGRGVWIENGRRNLLQYESFEDGGSISGWTNSGLETFTTTSNARKHQGVSAQIADTNGTGGQMYRAQSLTSGQSYPFYCYVQNIGSTRGVVNSSVASLYANGAITTNYTEVDGGWYKLSGTVTGTGANVNYGISIGSSQAVYVDGCQIEADYNSTNGVPYATSLIYNNSTNQRNRGEESLYYYAWRGNGNVQATTNIIEADKGTVSFWFRPEWASSQPNTDLYFFQMPNVIQTFFQQSSDSIVTQIYNGSNWTTAYVISNAQSFAANTDHHIAVTWNNTSGITLTVDGVKSSYSGTWTAQKNQININTYLYVGSKSSAGGRIDSLVSDFAIFRNNLADKDILQIYNSKAPIEDYQRNDYIMLQQNNSSYQRGNILLTGNINSGSINTGTLTTSFVSSSYIGLNNSANMASHVIFHLPFEGSLDGSRKEIATFTRPDTVSPAATTGDESSLKLINKNANEARIDRGFISNNVSVDTQNNTGNFGVHLEESRKNVALNSSFESMVGWTGNGTVTFSQASNGKVYHGNYSANLVSTGATRFFQTIDLSSIAIGTTHQVSAYMYRNESGNWGNTIDNSIASLYARTDDALSALSTTYTPMGNGWYRLTAEFVGTSSPSWDVGIYLPSSGRNVYVDSFQIERSSTDTSVRFPTTYIPTNGSAVTRATESLSYDLPSSFKSAKGGFSLWFKPQWSRAIAGDNGDKYLFMIPGAYRARLDGTNDRFVFEAYNGTSWTSAYINFGTTDVSRYYWNHLTCGWTVNYMYCRLNGNGSSSYTGWTPQNPSQNKIYIGSDNTGANQANAEIAAFTLFDAQLDSNQQNQLWFNRGKFEDYYRNDTVRLVANGSTSALEGSLHLTGNFLGGNGTVSLPTFSFNSDKDSGIYSIGNDIVGIGTSGTERIRITANGSVGIGVTNPGIYKLSVNGSVNVSNNLNVGGTIYGTVSGPVTSHIGFNQLTSATNTMGNMVVGTGASLSASGTGIINANQFGGYAITNIPFVNNTTNGTLTRSGSGPYTLGLNLGNANTWTGAQTFNANTYFPGSGIWNTSGNVGIGTTNASGKLTVSALSDTPGSGITVGSASTPYGSIRTAQTGPGAMVFDTYSGSAWNSGVLTLSTAGNVGIGTTNPTAKLHVSGNGNISGALNVGTSLNVVSNINLNGTTVINSSRAHLAGNGSVGAPSFTFSSDTNTGMYRGGTDILRLATAGVDRVTVLANGNVGINTTNPLVKLQIGTDNTGEPISLGSLVPKTLVMGVNNNTNVDSVFRLVRPTFSGNLYPASVDFKMSSTNTSFCGNGCLPGTKLTIGVKASASYDTSDTLDVFTLNSSGNVGIGTTNPTSKLEIAGSSSSISNTAGDITINSASNNISFSADNLINVASYNGYVPSRSASSVNSVYSLDSRGTNYMPMDRNAGLYVDFKQNGVDGLTDGGLYHGSLTFRAYGSTTDLSGGNPMQLAYTENGGLFTRLGTGTTSWGGWKKIITDNGINGNIGLGTTNPVTKAHVYGTLTVDPLGQSTNGYSEGIRIGSASNGYSIVTFGANPTVASGVQTNQWWVGKYGSDNGFNIYGNSIGDAFHILPSGNVGINTITPQAKLDLVSPAATTIQRWGYNDASAASSYNLKLDQNVTSGNVRWVFNQVNNGTSYPNSLVFNQGKIGIGTAEPDVKLEVAGTMKSSLTGTRHYYNVAEYTNSPITGTMFFTMPYYGSHTMLQIRLSGYTYSGGEGAWEVLIGGYNYGDHNWYNTSIETKGSPPFTSVRLGNNGSKDIIALGNTSTTWQYPQVVISEVVTSFTTLDGWGTGWTSAVTTSEPTLYNVTTLVPKIYTNAGGRIDIQASGSVTMTQRNTGSAAGYYWLMGPDASNNMLMYNQGSTGMYMCNGCTSWTANSDERIKKNFQNLSSSQGLEALMQLTPVTYNWKDDESNKTQIGLVAQEVQKVFPEIVTVGPATKYTPEGTLGIQYEKLIMPIIKAIQEQQGEIENLSNDLSVSSTGQININYNVSDEVLASLGYEGTKNEIESATYSLTDSMGNTITKISQFGQVIASKVNAGLVSATDIITNRIVANTAVANKLKVDVISPLSNTVTVDGNLSVASTLAAVDIQSTTVNTTDLTAQTATVSTLYADNIVSKEGSFGDLMANKISALREEMKKRILDATASALVAEAETWGFEIATDSAKLDGDLALSDNLVVGSQLMVNGDTHLASAFISGSLTAGEIQIRDNVVETTNTALYIQPSGEGSINMLNNLFIAQNGQIEINGSVRINGNLTASSATISGSLIANLLNAENATISGTLAANHIEANTIKVATDSATSLIIAESGFASLATSSAQISSNATAGSVTLPAGKTEIIVHNNLLTAGSMVYLTPVGSTQNQVPYLKAKTISPTPTPDTATNSAVIASTFTIAIDQPLNNNIEINWWIIN